MNLTLKLSNSSVTTSGGGSGSGGATGGNAINIFAVMGSNVGYGIHGSNITIGVVSQSTNLSPAAGGIQYSSTPISVTSHNPAVTLSPTNASAIFYNGQQITVGTSTRSVTLNPQG